MKIKSRYTEPILYRLFSRLKGRIRTIFLIVVISAIIAFAFLLGAYAHKSGLIHRALQNVHKITLIGNYFAGLRTTPEKLILDIKFKDYQKLLQDRRNAEEAGYLSTLNADENYVPLLVTYKNKTVHAKARIKGNSDYRFKPKWMLRIKVKGDETIMGTKVFSIHDPMAKNYMSEWLFQQLLAYNDLISLRYKFIEVIINGESDGIYAFEENFEKRLVENNKYREGVILRFDEYWNYYWYYTQRLDTWDNYVYRFYSMAPIDAFGTNRIARDSILNVQFLTAKNLLESYRMGKLPVEKVFDINKMAKLFAITDLTGSTHSLEVRNIRFYYNPITSLLEPIGYDQHEKIQPVDKLIGESKQFDTEDTAAKLEIWEDSFFRDTLFYKTYIKCLEEISKPEYLTGFFNKIQEEYENSIHLLYRDDISFKDESLDIIRYNQGYISRMLNPLKGVEVYYSELSNDSITIQIGSFHPLPIEIKTISLYGKEISDKNIEGTILDPKIDFKLIKHKTFRIGLDSALLTNETLDSLKVNCSFLGLDRRIPESIRHNSFYDETFLSNDFIRSDYNYKEFEFFKTDEEKRVIQIKPGVHNIVRDIKIPANYHVFCPPGVEFNIVNSSLILSYSSFYFIGMEDHPIIIHSSDLSGQGIVILNSKDTSRFEYVQFRGLSNPSKTGWELTGFLTFYESPVSFFNCGFINNLAGDDMLNIVRSDFVIKNCTFSQSFADAFDADFSAGSISDTRFLQCGNDAIDISGTGIKIKNILIKGTQDKGLSVGERSVLYGSNIEILNTNKAIVSKDSSLVVVDHNLISDCYIGYAAFRKKPEYGPARIVSTESSIHNVKVPYLIELKSQMFQDGKLIPADQKNLKELLYKVKTE